MIYRRLVLSYSVVQNCQVDICQAVDGVAVRVFTSQRSVQIRLGQFSLYQLHGADEFIDYDFHELHGFIQYQHSAMLLEVTWFIIKLSA